MSAVRSTKRRYKNTVHELTDSAFKFEFTKGDGRLASLGKRSCRKADVKYKDLDHSAESEPESPVTKPSISPAHEAALSLMLQAAADLERIDGATARAARFANAARGGDSLLDLAIRACAEVPALRVPPFG